MTDSDILEALEAQIRVSDTIGVNYCDGVPKRFFVDILDLINRQKEEIESLKVRLIIMATCKDCIHYDLCRYNAYQEAHYFGKDKKVYITIDNNSACKFFKSATEIKAEAIKEFWNELKKRNTMDERIVSVATGDNLVKEMVGE